MLKAILEGKSGRVSADGESDELSWRDVFRKREDLLTAVFFSRLRYLSSEGEQQVLALLVGREQAKKLGCITEIIFWPKLKGLENRKHVEPDLLVLFEHSLLLIEVKPPFGGLQYVDQWSAQIESLILQRDDEESEIEVPEKFHFLALGRNTAESYQAKGNLINSYSEGGLETVHIHEWDDVCRGIHKLADGETGRDRVVYEDWIDAFSLFGLIEPMRPFADMFNLQSVMDFDWRTAMCAYEVPMSNRSPSSLAWQEMLGLTNKLKLGIEIWQ